MEKESFVFYRSYYEAIKELEEKKQLELFQAITEYGLNEKEKNISGISKAMFNLIKPTLDSSSARYKASVENGKKGGRPKKITQEKPNNNLEITQQKPKQNLNVNVNENVNVNDNRNNVSDSCVDGLQDVIDFYNNNIGSLTPYGLQVIDDYVKEMGKDVVLYAMQISVEADKRTIQYIKAILNNWSKKGIKTLVEAQKESKMKPKKEPLMEFNKTQNDWEDLYDN